MNQCMNKKRVKRRGRRGEGGEESEKRRGEKVTTRILGYWKGLDGSPNQGATYKANIAQSVSWIKSLVCTGEQEGRRTGEDRRD